MTDAWGTYDNNPTLQRAVDLRRALDVIEQGLWTEGKDGTEVCFCCKARRDSQRHYSSCGAAALLTDYQRRTR